MSNIELVVFDWDGVVSESSRLQVESEKTTALAFAKDRGIDFEIDSYDWTLFQGWGRAKIAKSLFGVNDIEAELFRQQTVDTTLKILGPHNLSPVKGVASFIQLLRSYSIKTAVATSSHRAILDASISLFGYDDFLTTVAHREALDDKPLPGQYFEVMKRLNVPAENTLVIEDSRGGIEAGRFSGATVLGIATTMSPEDLQLKTDAHMGAVDFPHVAELLRLLS